MADAPRPTFGLPPRRTPPVVETEKKHVIAEYRHKQQLVTCVCGWEGSSESPDGRTSDWSRHVAASRGGSGKR